MDARRATELLHEHQNGLLTHIEGAARALDLDPADATVPLARARWEALRLIRAYQLFKHGELFDPMIAHGTPGQRDLAQRMKKRCVESVQRFVDHVTTWTMTDAAGDWDRYRAATVKMAEDMRREIMAERHDAEQLLHGIERTRTPTRARA